MVAAADMTRRTFFQHDAVKAQLVITIVDLQFVAYSGKRLDLSIVRQASQARVEGKAMPGFPVRYLR